MTEARKCASDPAETAWGAPARILVTDGETRVALACVRALAARGHTVHVAASGPRSLAAASRYAAGGHGVGDAAEDPRGWTERLERVATSIGAELLLPVTEVSLGSIYAFDVPDRWPVACPERAAYEFVVDKHALLERAGHLGLDVPRTLLFEDPSELSGLPEPFRYPVVVKARRSRFLKDGRWVRGDVRVVRSREELTEARAVPGFAGGVLLQEFVPGSGEGTFLLTSEGRPLVRFAHRRIREKPPWGGVSVLSEAILPDPELLAGSERLLAELSWTGLAMVEFRRTPEGRAFLMEVNPRLWGSLQLAINAGVDFPSLLVALERGAAVLPAEARIGTRNRWLLGDLDHLLICLRRPDVRALRGTGLRALLRDFFKSFGDGSRLEVLRRDDWRPFLRELREWMGG
jgi:predicted ATP-grasp superfamily ATP-dependent carboligase